MARTIKIHIDGDTVTIETKGYKGADCVTATRALEAAIGKVTSDTKTPEYYHREGVHREESQ